MPAVTEPADRINHPSLERLLLAAAKKDIHGPSALAGALGESAQTVTNWGRRGVSNKGAVKAQEHLGVSVTWVLEGVGPDFVRELAEVIPGSFLARFEPGLPGGGLQKDSNANTEPGPDIRGLVPLISWVAASDWCEAGDPYPPGVAEEWLPCPARHSAGTFALRVRGDSMTAPHGNSRTYPENCVIFVDPERRSPLNGDRIVACLDGATEVTFKVYKNEDGRQWLAPLNPSHEPIREHFRVLGTVIGKWEAE